MEKEWYKSKTLWANILAVTLLVMEHAVGVIPAVLSPEWEATIIAVVNFILRTVTNQPIGRR